MKEKGLKKFLTNGGRYGTGHPLLRRVFLLNTLLISMFFLCVIYTGLNILIPGDPRGLYINAACAVFSLATFIYFQKADNLEAATYIAVTLLILMLFAYFKVIQGESYGLYWMTIVPPVSYFLLGVKKARVVVALFFAYMLCFVLLSKGGWQPVSFDIKSIINIAGALLSLVLIIAFFEKSRMESAEALKKANEVLKDSKNEFRLILDTAAEGIFGVDTEGKCTFCNSRCLELLGYMSENDLIGKDMHVLIRRKYEDGSEMPEDESRIRKAVLSGEEVHSEDEIYQRADGSSFNVEFFSYPKYSGDKLTGAVITFLDISRRKKNEEKIQYLSRHDSLTGLLNRQYFELAMKEYDKEEFLPLSIIYGDLNGLKMTNDIFGHATGDELIIKAAAIMKTVCRKDDIVARIGGDEFVWLLPKTDAAATGRVMERAHSQLIREKSLIINVGMSLGSYTRYISSESMAQSLKNAEEDMYRQKSFDKKNNEDTILKGMIEALHERSPYEKSHSENTSALCAEIGAALGWSEADVRNIAEAGYYHDIGKITLGEGIINNNTPLTALERIEKQQHPIMGYRILNLFDSTLNLAEAVYSHHEHWDGTGYPKGLKGEEIPLNSRIIAIAEQYDHLRNRTYDQPLEKDEALKRIRKLAGVKYDPRLADLFVNIIK